MTMLRIFLPPKARFANGDLERGENSEGRDLP